MQQNFSYMMEYFNEKKPRNIQMKYPAPYSHSRIETSQNTEGIRRKSKISNTHEDCTESVSFPNGAVRAGKRGKRRASVTMGGTLSNKYLQECNLMRGRVKVEVPAGSCRRLRPDLTASHLKYGLFPKKFNNRTDSQLSSPPGGKMSSVADRPIKEGKILTQSRVTNKGNVPQGDAPLLVYREPAPLVARRLTLSPPAHVDIRPRGAPRRTQGPI